MSALELDFLAATGTPSRQIGMYDDNHRYYWNGAGPLSSVTGILKLQDALLGDGLTTWAAGIAADYVIGEWRVLEWNFADPEYQAAVRSRAVAAVNAKRNLGSAVHGQISDMLNGLAVIPTVVTAPYIYGWARFGAEKRPEYLHNEQVVLSPTHGFAGRFDFIARISGRLALVDVKTGKLKASHRLQLAGYAAADFIGKVADPTEYPLPRIRDYYVLLLREGSYELVPMKVTAADRRHFLELAKTYRKAKAWEKQ